MASAKKSFQPLQRIAVLVSLGIHPVSGTARYSRNDAAALGMALSLANANAAISITVYHAGNPENPALADYLALGASTVNVIATTEDVDIVPTLTQALQGYDLVLCGSRAEGGEQSGMLPYLLANQLGMALVSGVIEVEPNVDGDVDSLITKQFLPKGRRREVAVRLPVVLMVHPLTPSSVRYAYARLRAGSIQNHVAQLQVPPSSQAHSSEQLSDQMNKQLGIKIDWKLSPVTAKPLKLVAKEKRSGHDRMNAAIVAESRGGQVIQQGSASDKAQAVLAYLREHKLVDY